MKIIILTKNSSKPISFGMRTIFIILIAFFGLNLFLADYYSDNKIFKNKGTINKKAKLYCNFEKLNRYK